MTNGALCKSRPRHCYAAPQHQRAFWTELKRETSELMILAAIEAEKD
jgi:hypothetical protein